MSIFQQHYTLADILTLSFLSCSILACSLVCIHYLSKKHGLADTADRLLFCLACSDLVGALMWFLDINFPGILCPYSGVINMFGYQAAQIWTCIIGAYLIITCSAKQPPHELLFYCIAWGAPVIIQIIILSLHMYTVNPAPHGCWINYGSIQIMLVTVPQMLSGFLNIVFLSTIVYKMRISARRWGLKSRDRGLFFVMVCFLLTTVSGILETIPTRGHGDSNLYVVAVCFGGLQGFFNSIAMKQKAILLFLGKVKTKIRPPPPRAAKLLPNYASTNYSSYSSARLLNEDRTPNSPSTDDYPSHPASTDSYTNYYKSSILNPSRPTSDATSFSAKHPQLGQASMASFSLSPFPTSGSGTTTTPPTSPSPPSPSSS